MAEDLNKLHISLEIKGFDEDALFAYIEDTIDGGLEKLAEEVEWQWRIKAGETLNKSKDKYLEGLKVEVGSEGVEVSLNNWLGVAVESGSTEFDLKPGFLQGAASRVIPLEKETGTPIFRTVSIDSNGWIHPGIEARAIHKQIENDMDNIVNETFKNLFK